LVKTKHVTPDKTLAATGNITHYMAIGMTTTGDLVSLYHEIKLFELKRIKIWVGYLELLAGDLEP
jgi:hypothetical protein